MDLNLRKSVYTYLGYKNIEQSSDIDNLIDSCMEEVVKLSRFKTMHQEYDYLLDFLNNDDVYKEFLSGTSSYFITAYTLGVDVDKKIRSLSFTDMVRMVVMDACASAYLEYLSDLEDKKLGDDLTYRFCPGYQGTKASDLKDIFKIMNVSKLGITLLDSNIMVPQKTMVGIVGKGKQVKKTCGNCMLKAKCVHIKEGTRCYN